MEPLSPAFRESLKQAHPGLDDRDIDEFEELTVRRAMTPPEDEGESIRELDLRIDRLIQEKMPRFREVARENAARLRDARDRGAESLSKVDIESKRDLTSS
jgi:hypothetical protein